MKIQIFNKHSRFYCKEQDIILPNSKILIHKSEHWKQIWKQIIDWTFLNRRDKFWSGMQWKKGVEELGIFFFWIKMAWNEDRDRARNERP